MPILPNKVYNIMKWLCVTVMPALVVLIRHLGPIWGWNWSDAVSDTIEAVALFVGACIAVSTLSYNSNQDEDESITVEGPRDE